ncbi:aminoglycoside phosphotransferase family protein [Nocardioides sp. Leaf307]|uniref:aminoglycoside phosphotransferase family protein n=1 Tax=Nocardioides sp. Leaf307 TaxID=1736331 RepID=UPI000B013F22|nr:aminoglycoside phosphotransferase family protein [Nocardioides sp. Leaf307]
MDPVPPAPTAPVRLQPLTRARVADLGEPARAWAAGLPAVLAELCARWGLTPGRRLPGGSASYVVGARTARGEERVLKLRLPDPALADEAGALRRADGRGHVLLHDHDERHDALLLEALGGSLEQSPLAPHDALAVLAATLREAWTVPLPEGPPPPPGERALALAALLRRRDADLGRPCDPRVLTAALDAAERRAGADDPARHVVLHGDPHPANALRVRTPRPGAPTGWVLVDPDGVRGDPAHDLGVALRDWTSRLVGPDPRGVLRDYAARLADATGHDADAVWDWGYLERVSTGLYVLSFGADTLGRRFLDSARALVD